MRAVLGEHDPGDPNFGNNSSFLSSWFGPRAELVLTGTKVPQATPGTARIISSAKNKGPNTATSLQMLVEIKSLTFSSVGASTNQPGASCVFTTPEPGFNVAVSCTLPSLATGLTWTETFDYTGGSGKKLNTDTTITAASPTDPVLTDNEHKTQATYA